MRDILDRLSVGVVLLSEDGSVSFANSFCTERGIVLREYMGRKYYEVFKSLELIGFVSDLLEGSPKEIEFEHSGRTYRASPLGDRAFQIEDITELKKFEKIQREFTASVSHELSTPLTAVKGLLETALMKEKPNRELLEKALRRLEDIEKLISSLRLLVSIESGHRILRERFSLNDLLKGILEDLGKEIEEKRLRIELEGEDTEVESDREKLYILFKNIIENAVRYNRKGGVVHISMKRGGPGTVVVIRDTGEGIPREEIPFLFQPFLGGKNKKGMGLGLAISKKIADLLGAELRIESEEGMGTTVEVLLTR